MQPLPPQVAMAHNKLQAMSHHPASEEDGEENLEARWTVLKRFTQKIVITTMSREIIRAEREKKEAHHTYEKPMKQPAAAEV